MLLGVLHFPQEHSKTISYAKFGGQTECIMGNWKILIVNYLVPCAINKGGFFEIAFVIVVDTHLPRFEALAYVLPHFDELTHVVIRASSSVC